MLPFNNNTAFERSVILANGWRVSEVPFKGILASKVAIFLIRISNRIFREFVGG
jgi:hypothetical protein